MRTASLKTFPLAKTKIRYRGCMGNGLPRLLVQGGGIRTSVMQKGGWKNHSWISIAEMLEFDLFWMCFPDNYIWEVVVPMTNRYIDGRNMTLQDFYVWLGCHFFMAGFEGIENNKM